MSAALLTLLQTSLVDQPAPGSGTKKVPTSAAPDTTTGTLACSATPPSEGPALLLPEMLKVMKDIAHMDEMMAKTRANVPEGAEAQKWHEVSLQALVWSRDALTQRQQALLLRLKACTEQTKSQEQTEQPKAHWPAVKRSSMPVATHWPATTKEPSRAPGPAGVGSLKADLEHLRRYETGRIFLVRQIGKLGLDSAKKLEAHFARYGPVVDVRVAHSFEKPSPKRANGRLRPATRGFLVMGDAAAVQRVLEAGERHAVEDGAERVEVLVECFAPSGDQCGEEA